MKHTLYTVALGLALPATSSAHSGHAHSYGDTLTGMLHTLMTHPVLFGVIGLLLLGAMLYKRQ